MAIMLCWISYAVQSQFGSVLECLRIQIGIADRFCRMRYLSLLWSCSTVASLLSTDPMWKSCPMLPLLPYIKDWFQQLWPGTWVKVWIVKGWIVPSGFCSTEQCGPKSVAMCLRVSVKGAADSVFQGLIFIFFKPGGGKQLDLSVFSKQ